MYNTQISRSYRNENLTDRASGVGDTAAWSRRPRKIHRATLAPPFGQNVDGHSHLLPESIPTGKSRQKYQSLYENVHCDILNNKFIRIKYVNCFKVRGEENRIRIVVEEKNSVDLMSRERSCDFNGKTWSHLNLIWQRIWTWIISGWNSGRFSKFDASKEWASSFA